MKQTAKQPHRGGVAKYRRRHREEKIIIARSLNNARTHRAKASCWPSTMALASRVTRPGSHHYGVRRGVAA